jgi:hypothetical protein
MTMMQTFEVTADKFNLLTVPENFLYFHPAVCLTHFSSVILPSNPAD